VGKLFVKEDDILKFLNENGFFVCEYKSLERTSDEIDLHEMVTEVKIRPFGGGKIIDASAVCDDMEFELVYFKPYKAKNGQTYTRVKSISLGDEFRDFMFESYGEEYLDFLEKAAKEERSKAISAAMEDLNRRVCDREIVSAVLRNALTSASKKQIFVKIKRAKLKESANEI